jgi:RimJ/RimL family protein N-acetyltransferase
MTIHRNNLGQPIGPPLPGWNPPPRPPREATQGRYCRIEPLDPARHAADLHAVNTLDPSGRAWTYMNYGPFDSLENYREWMQSFCMGDDPMFHAIVDVSTGEAVGVASYLRIDAAHGVIEVGHINYSPRLQRTRTATEAMFLMMHRAFSLGYRRYEWKCDALNAPSRAAAQRLGFTYEGIFRQATIYKNRSRDTAWFSIIDSEWPALRDAFTRWLDPENFDAQGRQRERLPDLTAAALRNTPSVREG